MFFLAWLLLGLTAVFWILRRLKILTVCPVCAAAMLTWITGLALFIAGSPMANLMLMVILMAASLGALAEKLGNRFGPVWKTVWVLSGTGAIYFLQDAQWAKAAVLLVVMLAITLLFYFFYGSRSPLAKDKFEDCC